MKTKVKRFAQTLLNRQIYEKGRKTFHYLKPLPDFLIIGTRKGGTTSLYHYLISHPKIYSAVKKELYFFDYKFSKGVRWYRRHFSLFSRLKQNVITGEASPDYLYYPFTADRISSIIPDVKLIVLLRNPVDRAISHYWNEVNDGWENLPMEKAFKKERERLKNGEREIQRNNSDFSFAHKHFSYLDRGKYARQIGSYFKHFNRKQILIIKSENFFQNTQDVFNKILSFLGFNSHPISYSTPQNEEINHNETDENLRKELEEYFQPHNDQLYKLLDRNLGW